MLSNSDLVNLYGAIYEELIKRKEYFLANYFITVAFKLALRDYITEIYNDESSPHVIEKELSNRTVMSRDKSEPLSIDSKSK